MRAMLRRSFLTRNCANLLFRGKEDQAESRIIRVNENKAIDEKYGFSAPKESGEKIGYLINMHTVGCEIIVFQYIPVDSSFFFSDRNI